MKQKRFILTETGEVRPPKYGEYYVRINGDKNPDFASYDFTKSKPILKLEVEEVEWKPKVGDKYYCIDFYNMSVIQPMILNLNDDYHKTNLRNNNMFPTKELAEQKLAKIKQVLKGEI